MVFIYLKCVVCATYFRSNPPKNQGIDSEISIFHFNGLITQKTLNTLGFIWIFRLVKPTPKSYRSSFQAFAICSVSCMKNSRVFPTYSAVLEHQVLLHRNLENISRISQCTHKRCAIMIAS